MRDDAALILASVREKAESVGIAQRWGERTSVPANNASLSDLIDPSTDRGRAVAIHLCPGSRQFLIQHRQSRRANALRHTNNHQTKPGFPRQSFTQLQ
jgi:hypothetical protein